MAFSALAQTGMFTGLLAPHAVREALSYEGEGITYAALDAQAGQAAATAWHAWGVRTGDRVAWLGGNHPGLLALLFGLARIGAALLPLNIRLANAEWATQMHQCTPVHLVHDAAWADAARALGGACGVPVHDADEWTQRELGAAPDHAAPDAPLLLVFTSGTTGGPKAAVHTQANLLANMRIAAAVQAITPQDRVLAVLPLFHVGGLCIQTLPALYTGAKVLLHPRFTPEATLNALESDRPTLTLQVPATMKALVEHARWATSDLSSLRACWAGSSLLPSALVRAFHARGVPLCNVYGATETGPFSIALPPEHAMDHVGSCGWPAPGVEVSFGERHGEAAELRVRGPNVVARYWPDVAACDAQGWFATGDLAVQAGDGSYTVVGRSRDLVISGGENVHPAEIEQVLATHPAVAECVAFGVPDARWGEAVAAAVVLRAGARADEAALGAHVAAQLARFKVPRRWFFVDELPKTALGKVQRVKVAASVVR